MYKTNLAWDVIFILFKLYDCTENPPHCKKGLQVYNSKNSYFPFINY